MNAHNFTKSLQNEVDFWNSADNFYKEKLHAIKIERYDFKSTYGKEMQRKDIDLKLTTEKGIYLVSEKKRSRYFGDLYLESYSKYPNTAGWIEHTEADLFAYFFTETALILNMNQMKNFYFAVLKSNIQTTWYNKIYSNKEKSLYQKYNISLNGKSYDIYIIQAYNKNGGSEWYTLGFSIPLIVLKDNNIIYKEYKL